MIDKSDKKASKGEPATTSPVEVTVITPEPVVEVKHYEPRMWRGVKKVYQCSACQHCERNVKHYSTS
jgi:hypothetical protein